MIMSEYTYMHDYRYKSTIRYTKILTMKHENKNAIEQDTASDYDFE